MRRLPACWATAAAVWVLGTAVTAISLPGLEPGATLSPTDQLLRLHLPWVLTSLLMTMAAATLYRDRTRWAPWLLAGATVPALVTLGGAAAAALGPVGAPAVALYVLEGAGGTAAGLAAAWKVSGGGRPAAGYW